MPGCNVDATAIFGICLKSSQVSLLDFGDDGCAVASDGSKTQTFSDDLKVVWILLGAEELSAHLFQLSDAGIVDFSISSTFWEFEAPVIEARNIDFSSDATEYLWRETGPH